MAPKLRRSTSSRGCSSQRRWWMPQDVRAARALHQGSRLWRIVFGEVRRASLAPLAEACRRLATYPGRSSRCVCVGSFARRQGSALRKARRQTLGPGERIHSVLGTRVLQASSCVECYQNVLHRQVSLGTRMAEQRTTIRARGAMPPAHFRGSFRHEGPAPQVGTAPGSAG
jgi:hypothetical protein